MITSADNKNFIITAATASPMAGENITYTPIGLVRSHLYTLLGAYTVKNANGTVVDYLYRIRNPWATDDKFNGTWNDNSALWNDTINNYKG